MRRALLLLALLLLLAPRAPLAAQDADARDATVVFLVRHAEKAATPGPDPELSEAGRARAAALAEALRDAGVDAVLATQFRRTQLTAEPLAAALGVAPEVVRAEGGAEAHARAVADAVRARHVGRTVLVVGHSNTVPAIVGALGGPRLEELCEGEYANLFVMVLRPGEEPALARSRFGAADPEGAAACRRETRRE